MCLSATLTRCWAKGLSRWSREREKEKGFDTGGENLPVFLCGGRSHRLRRGRRACRLMGRALASDGDPKGCRGRAESHPASMTRDSFAVRNYPLVGIDAPTPAREKGLQPYGALTLFFRWRKKSVQKKASGTATPEKSPLLPIFERGSSQCRAQHG